MPYDNHPSCKLPQNMEEKTWRYMGFTKFLSLLEEKALFFSKVSSFTDTDPFEGFLTKPTMKMLSSIPDDLPTQKRQEIEKIKKHNLRTIQMGRELLDVSSWHISPFESVAMWQLYLKSGEGLAIQSTVQRMVDSFQDTSEPVYLGLVDYVDYNEDEIPWTNIFYLVLHKRKSFEHEKEIRALIMTHYSSTGSLVPVTLDVLIEKVYIAPDSPIWIHELAKKVLNRYGLKKEVVHSGLEERPLY